ncbi:MAG: Maleate cis-trans isomerase [Chloroflexi bacterium]|jgi:maleate cis-trans isomerase|nr:MAG: Maleate cis-trans isomerase [Chloroflexota bacterium]
MASDGKVRIGFIAPRFTTLLEPHLLSIMPDEVSLEIECIGVADDNPLVTDLYDLSETKGTYVERTAQAVKDRGWEGVNISGAPVELLNPGLLDELRQAIPVPVITAIRACRAALQALEVSRVLLITPFDDNFDGGISGLLKEGGIEATYPTSKPFTHFGVGWQMNKGEARVFIKNCFDQAGKVDAVYFQGPLSEHVAMLQQVEDEYGVPAISSLATWSWYLLSTLGKSYSLKGAGTLFAEWPKLKEA